MCDLWFIPMVYNNILHDIPECEPPRTYVRTYVVRENRSSIQSLVLMRSAIKYSVTLKSNFQKHTAVETLPLHALVKWVRM